MNADRSFPGIERCTYAALILAAGRSSRMPGGSKLLASFGGGTVLGTVVATARNAGLEPVIIVASGSTADMRKAVAGTRVRYTVLASAGGGRLDSVQAGLAAVVRAGAPGVAILLGDEPGLRSDHLRAVVEAVRAGPEVAGRAEYRDRPGHPVVMKSTALPSMIERTPSEHRDACLWDLIRSSGLTYRGIPVDADGPIDVDTPESLARARARNAVR